MTSALDEMVKSFVLMVLALDDEDRIEICVQDGQVDIDIRFLSLHLS